MTIIENFKREIETAKDVLNKKWINREVIGASKFMIEVLYLRNTDIYDSICLLLNKDRISSAEILLRSLFEGTVIFEWCMLDPFKNAHRFRITSFKNTLELIEEGLITKSPEYIETLKGAIQSGSEEKYKNMPNMRQMLESIETYNKDKIYQYYKLLSRVNHFVFEEIWSDYMPTEEENDKIMKKEYDEDKKKNTWVRVLFLQMRNIVLISNFDEYMRYKDIRKLETKWNHVYTYLTYVKK